MSISQEQKQFNAGAVHLPRRRDLPARAAAEELLVRDPSAGRVHFLNPTAALIWECCDGNTTLDDCVEQLRMRFKVSGTVDLAGDVRSTLADFSRRGLIENADSHA